MRKRKHFLRRIFRTTLLTGIAVGAAVAPRGMYTPAYNTFEEDVPIIPQLFENEQTDSSERKASSEQGGIVGWGENTEHMIDAPFIDQTGDYPTGCESVSAVMALQYLGLNISVDDFIDNYLDCGRAPYQIKDGLVGDSPYDCFLGSPYESTGWGCYAPVIEKALTRLAKEESFHVKRPKGKELQELCRDYIDADIPVILWATMEMKDAYMTSTWETPSGESITWIAPEHCLLLVGYDEDNYYFNDPRQGKQTGYSKSEVEAAYESLGEQAVVVFL